MKKLVIINVAVLLMLFITVVFPNYYINYPAYFNLAGFFAFFEWQLFFGILIAGVVLSGLLACVKFRNIPYLHRLWGLNILMNAIFLIFIIGDGVFAILDAQKEYEALKSEYQMKAASDMKNGLIIHETAGLPMPLDSAAQVKRNQIDSLMKTYGLASRNVGCVITGPLLKAQSYYEELTAPYLERRNGPGWRRRMEAQIEEIRKN